MKRFAIDIVILPPDPVMDLALAWNRVLCKARPAAIVLNKTDYLPHISLAMGCLPANQLEHAGSILKSISDQHHTLQLHVPQIITVGSASGDAIVTFDIELSPELAGFHESIVSAFRPVLSQDATEKDMGDPPPIENSSLNWINQFIPNSCFHHFWPHITLGFGVQQDNFRPFSFQGSRVAICHLGNHCTCRRILAEVFLEPLLL